MFQAEGFFVWEQILGGIVFWPKRIVICLTLLLVGGIALAATGKPADKTPSKSKATHTTEAHKSTHKTSHTRRHSSRRRKASWRYRGQQRIAPERAEQIQKALIKANYLHGDPSGKWDEATEKAMQKYQSDHNWQTKIIPDSRALISLGLGPDQEHLLNPKSAMTTVPSQSPKPTSTAAAPTSTAPSTDASPARSADPPAASKSPAP